MHHNLSYNPLLPSYFAVGIPLQLTFSQGSRKLHCGSTLLGWKEGAWLICEWPFHLGQAVPCEIGTSCLVRYTFEGRMIGYRSEVREKQLLPLPLLFLALPQTVEEIPLRKHVRVPTNEPLLLIRVEQMSDVNRSSGPELVGGLLRDLSVSGCSVAIERRAPDLLPGTHVRLEFELIGIGHVTNLAGLVKNISEDPPRAVIGIEFRFHGAEYIEYRGWGGTVQRAIEYAVLQKQASLGTLPPTTLIAE